MADLHPDGIAILNEETTPVASPASEEKKAELPTSRFVQHLATYPSVAAVASLAASVPVVKIFVSNAIPVAMYLNERSKPVTEPVVKRATPIISKVDQLGDDLLSNVDKKFPQLKTTQPSDVVSLATKPVDQARNTAVSYGDAAKDAVTHRVIDPIKSATHKARAQYAKVYDTQGKALIRSRIDPLVLPLNDRLAVVIEEYFPQAGDTTNADLTSSDEVSNQLSRSWRLALTAYRRATPAVVNQANHVIEIPAATTHHIHQIYEEKQAIHSKGKKPTLYTSALAGLGTCYQLTEEGRQAISSSLQSQKDSLAASVKGLYKNVEAAEEDAKGRITSATAQIKSYIPGLKIKIEEAADDITNDETLIPNGN